jgi:trehalose utilization protein
MNTQASELQVVIWNEFIHERTNPAVQAIYPEGIHTELASIVREYFGATANVQSATLEEPEHGLTENVLQQADALLWWGHAAHEEVADSVVSRIYRRVLEGMGLIVLHSGHGSKIFRKLMGTECMLRWREAGELERLWITAPGHPILDGIEGDYFELPQAEMYGEHFDIPTPDELLLISWFEGGEVFRSGCTFRRGQGNIFYFRPGHETYPIYRDPNIRRIIANAVSWARRPITGSYDPQARHIPTPLNRLADQ